MGSNLSERHPGEINFSNLIFKEQIGEGGEATVYRVTFKIPYRGFKEAAAKNVRSFDVAEVNLLRKLQHKNIVALLGYCQKAPNNILILELASNGSLYDYLIRNRSTPLPSDLFTKWVRESALAVQHLHENNIIHRDIKPQNCLIFENTTLKLSDFGLAKELRLDKSQTSSDIKGTFQYMAPEIIRGRDDGRTSYSKYADIYAFGMLLLVMHTRSPPFENQQYGYVVFNVGNGKLKPTIPPDFPADLSAIMQRCWEFERKNRPDINEIVQETSHIENNTERDCQYNFLKKSIHLLYIYVTNHSSIALFLALCFAVFNLQSSVTLIDFVKITCLFVVLAYTPYYIRHRVNTSRSRWLGYFIKALITSLYFIYVYFCLAIAPQLIMGPPR